MTYERQQVVTAFLKLHALEDAVCVALPSDASFRQYYRIFSDERQYILMDAPSPAEDVKPFVTVGRYLRACGLSAPEIYAQDIDNGLLLLEDLGDNRFTALLTQSMDNQKESAFYREAVAALSHLQAQEVPKNFPFYTTECLMREITLFVEWYLPRVRGIEHLQQKTKAYIALWESLLAPSRNYRPVLVLRDYHADNLMWLPKRSGIERVGVLDFQDAVIGHPVYDLISLLEDARRDISLATVSMAKAYYQEQVGYPDGVRFEEDYAFYAAQRNCKILGIFARLAVRDHKPRYLEYIPRVWKHLERDMQHPLLVPLKAWFDDTIPSALRAPEMIDLSEKQEGMSVWA